MRKRQKLQLNLQYENEEENGRANINNENIELTGVHVPSNCDILCQSEPDWTMQVIFIYFISMFKY